MKKMNLEMIVGLFLLAGFACFSYLAIKMGDIKLFGNETYAITARFTSPRLLSLVEVVAWAKSRRTSRPEKGFRITPSVPRFETACASPMCVAG